jgi:flagellar biosynthesis/type III secretory pathway protein FliH
MSSSSAGSAGAAAWLPAPAWDDAPAPGAPGAPAAWGEFTPGLFGALGTEAGRAAPRPVAPAHAGPRGHASPAAFSDGLPDFGAAGPAPAVGAADALRRACAAAADAREVELRAEFEAAWAAEAGALQADAAAHAEAAYAEGVAAGRAEGAEAARAELAAAAGALDAAAAEVAAHAARWTADLQAHVAALAVAVARHVIGREAVAGEPLVPDLVARAVAEFPADQPLAARVHPADVPALKAAWAGAPRAAELRWVPDAAVVRGGALVEGRERIVDGRVDAALERLYRAVGGHQA